MGLLDELKKQAETLKGEAQRTTSESLVLNTKLTEAKMQQTFQFLSELIKQLNVLRPESPRGFDIETAGRFENLSLDDFFLDYRKKKIGDKEYFDHIILRFKHGSDQVLEVKRDAKQLIDRLRDFLLASNIKFEMSEKKNERGFVMDATFRIPYVVRSEVIIHAKGDIAQLVFKIKNIERISSFELQFPASEVTENMLDEFARYVVGKTNKFKDIGQYMTLSRPVSASALAADKGAPDGKPGWTTDKG
jgi:hypothetical protein